MILQVSSTNTVPQCVHLGYYACEEVTKKIMVNCCTVTASLSCVILQRWFASLLLCHNNSSVTNGLSTNNPTSWDLLFSLSMVWVKFYKIQRLSQFSLLEQALQ